MPSENFSKVIILDDHPMIIDGIRLLLEGAQQFVLTGQANDIRELITLLDSPAGILILDLNIKGKNILDQIPVIRAKKPAVKILVFSSYNTPSLVRKAFAQQVNGYLLKDTTQDELLEALGRIASGKVFIGKNVHVPKNGLVFKEPDDDLKDVFQKKYALTEREVEIIRLMAKGHDSKNMAAALFISQHTVQSHRKNIMRKLDLHSAAEVTRFALENGLT